MSEPTLESISDYDTLQGEKKKVVWAVILAGLLMGVIYTIVYTNDTVDDVIKVEESIKIMPVK